MKYFTRILLLCLSITACSKPASDRHTDGRFKAVSLGPALTEQIFLLNAGSNLAADTSYCVRPQAAVRITNIGDLLRINIELIYKLKPDIVLATGLTRPENITRLKQLGLKVKVFPMPSSFKEICSQFRELGTIFDKKKKAHAVITECRDELKRITNQTGKLPLKTVFFQIGDKPLYGAAANSYLHQYILFSGCCNVLRHKKSGAYSYEKLLQTDPDIIITTLMGMQKEDVLAKWYQFKSLQAVKKNNILIVDQYEACSSNPVTFIKTLKKIASFSHKQELNL
ncbi:MAG TPA: ABC transporter substrate-binding protein [Spirochaetota bacterium]|nr:ABC transporter substrate-binding protein [Spirochaetota bacterium]